MYQSQHGPGLHRLRAGEHGDHVHQHLYLPLLPHQLWHLLWYVQVRPLNLDKMLVLMLGWQFVIFDLKSDLG